jgi:hypothetical protein
VFRLLTLVAMAALTSGCASIVNETTQPVRIETRKADGANVDGAECKLTNDYGTASVRSGETSQVRRSGRDLDITCRHPANPDAVARAISRANSGLAGNIIFGGGIGAIIDHSKGTAYTYPTWIRLVFGQTLVFDRSNEKEGQPVPGMAPPATPAATAPAAAPAAVPVAPPASAAGR